VCKIINTHLSISNNFTTVSLFFIMAVIQRIYVWQNKVYIKSCSLSLKYFQCFWTKFDTSEVHFSASFIIGHIWLLGGTATGLWTWQEPVFMYILLKMKTMSVFLMLTVWPSYTKFHHSESWIHTGVALILKPELLYIKLCSSWFISAVISVYSKWKPGKL
jgi:hypothetical protein